MPLFPLRRLLLTFILLIAALLLRAAVLDIPPVYWGLLDWLPYVILAAALALCVYFNRSLLFTAVLALLSIYFLIHTQLQISLSEPRAMFIYTFISLAVPITLVLLCIYPERGLRSGYGMLLVTIVPLQWLAGAILLAYFSGSAVIQTVIALMPIRPVSGYSLSIVATLVFIGCSVPGFYKLYRHDREADAALLSALLFSFVTLAFLAHGKISTILFSAAGISLIISLVRNSHEMAYRDDLTGLLGRRALNERLRGLRGQYVIAMLDVDHFKKFNDTYGHDMGDEVLKMVAKQIGGVGGGGTAYRYGGEEFCIVFAGRIFDQCEPHLEDVRIGIEEYEMSVRDSRNRPKSKAVGKERRGRRARSRNGNTVSVTISIGMAQRNKRLNQPQKVIKAADKALYKAKDNGRNCLAKQNV